MFPLEFLNVFTFVSLFIGINCKIINFEEKGAIADDFGLETAWNNGRIMNETLSSLEPG